jgi:hypothetical protein
VPSQELEETPEAASAPTPSTETVSRPVDPAEVAGPVVGQETAGRRAVRLPDGKILLPQDR